MHQEERFYHQQGAFDDCGLPSVFLLFRNFSVAISVSPHVCFI